MKKLIGTLLLLLLSGCGGDVGDSIDVLINDPARKDIDTTRMGVNAFFNERGVGTVREQALEVKNTIRLNHVRILIPWIDTNQPCRTCRYDFGLSDSILDNLPEGTDALVVITNAPSWAKTGAEGRKEFVELFVDKVTKRYANHPRISAWQLWNEPDNSDFEENARLDVLYSPENYVELIAMASQVVRQNSPNHLIVSGATTGIAQNWPDTIDYNRDMRAAGIQEFIDIFAIHYYGTNFVNVTRPGKNVRDFARGLKVPIWITESGITGTNNQLEYVERTWPFIRDQFRGIDRIYYYRFLDSSAPANETFGLRNLTPGKELSDLYIYLRDRANEQ